MSRLFHRERTGLPGGWRDILTARSAQWALLDDDERARLGEVADDIARTKRWEAARGFELTDEVRTVIAAHAALLALGLDGMPFDGVGTIVVRSRAMRRTTPMAGPAKGVVMDSPGAVDGEAHHADGPVMVVWASARREAANMRTGRDVVLHEFAHKLDMLDGTIDGTPPIDDEAQRAQWVETCTAAYQTLRSGEGGWPLRSYGGSNPGEFFAVATETFFVQPLQLQSAQPGLYEAFASYYRQDPAGRVRRAAGRIAGS